MGYYNKPHSGRRRSYTNSKPNKRGGRKHGQYIDPSRFVKQANPVTHEEYLATHDFSDFNLNPLIVKNLASKGYVTPSPVQDQTIPHILDHKDIIGIAATGTGKTGAFAIPVLHKLLTSAHSKALIVAPTRELAQQIYAECHSIAKGADIDAAILIGGSSMGPQLRDLKAKPSIVIGTPGRIKDHLERKTLRLETFNTVVLDEVDRMLDMGFVHDITIILSHLADKRQSLFFSATLDKRVNDLISTFSHEPITIKLKNNEASANVHQDVVKVSSSSDKLDALHNLLIEPDKIKKAILFDETQRRVERLQQSLTQRGFNVEAIHGGKSQGQRMRALKKFKDNDVNILVATDVAARGIDIIDVTHVINYSVPQTYEDYIHRIGRTGRAGQTGYALTFIDNK